MRGYTGESMTKKCCREFCKRFLLSCEPGPHNVECPVCKETHTILKIAYSEGLQGLNGQSFSFISIDELYEGRL